MSGLANSVVGDWAGPVLNPAHWSMADDWEEASFDNDSRILDRAEAQFDLAAIKHLGE
jgi:hypothetical protein